MRNGLRMYVYKHTILSIFLSKVVRTRCLIQDYHARLVHLRTTAFIAAAIVQLHTLAALMCAQTHALEVAPPPHHLSTRVIQHTTFLPSPAELRVQNASQ